MGTKPTHEQAQLHLQVYDLRREARLRQARDWFQQNYRAETMAKTHPPERGKKRSGKRIKGSKKQKGGY